MQGSTCQGCQLLLLSFAGSGMVHKEMVHKAMWKCMPCSSAETCQGRAGAQRGFCFCAPSPHSGTPHCPCLLDVQGRRAQALQSGLMRSLRGSPAAWQDPGVGGESQEGRDKGWEKEHRGAVQS